jgi:ATP-dependent protease Clp ATPase subunit
MFLKRQLACSFCGKTAAQVSKLVAGGRGYICNTCAAEAHRIMSDSGPAKSASTAPPRGLASRLVARLKRLWTYGQTFDPRSVA